MPGRQQGGNGRQQGGNGRQQGGNGRQQGGNGSSSRAVSACLQLDKDKLHAVSCYAPTRAASRQERNTFFDDLNSILPSVPAGEKHIVLVTSMHMLGLGKLQVTSGVK